ncbi:MAG: UPF0056 inner membrane protein [Phycisphaerales bacterium]|nr:MarC family protein [Phycisphaerales bacterium]GIK18898.1 MAG: UPF0056 inner membrane protein [Planctomycetota bacterium]
MERLLNDFVLLFTIIDPVGSVPVFIAIASRAAPGLRRRIAFRAVLVSAGVLLFFGIFGQFVLNAMGISLHAFRVAGGIILFLFALDMIFGTSKPESEVSVVPKAAADAYDLAIYPLAIPSIAGPGSIVAIVVTTDNAKFSVIQQAATLGIMLVVLGIVLACLLIAERIHRLIGQAGASIISRVMGLITAGIAANGVLTGLQGFFGLGATAG